MRYLAIDFGRRRTGLAVGDDVTGVVTALAPVVTAHGQERLRGIGRMIERQGPDGLVVGLPLNMDGTEGDAAIEVKGFVEELRRRFELPVHLFDERLTSAAADGAMAGSGLTHGQKKARRDGQAAAALLRDFLGRSPS